MPPELSLPEMRIELISILQSLSSREYQRRVWIEGRRESGIKHDEFDYVVHFIYDDTDLSADAGSLIGVFLYNDAEAKAITNVVCALESVFSECGMTASDQKYIESKSWEMVVSSSRTALDLLTENDDIRK